MTSRLELVGGLENQLWITLVLIAYVWGLSMTCCLV